VSEPGGHLDTRIALSELADELQCHKQSLFKIAKRLGINPIKQRDINRRNQLVAMITNEEAQLIKTEFLMRAVNSNQLGADSDLAITEDGVFYLLQLEPTHDPGRIKLGFTTDLDGRLRKHRCSAPFAQCLKTWPCRRIWERTVIDAVTTGMEVLHTEVFRTGCLNSAIQKADQIFALLPSVQIEQEVDAE
jgi:hypothetical protein